VDEARREIGEIPPPEGGRIISQSGCALEIATSKASESKNNETSRVLFHLNPIAILDTSLPAIALARAADRFRGGLARYSKYQFAI